MQVEIIIMQIKNKIMNKINKKKTILNLMSLLTIHIKRLISSIFYM